MRHGHTGAVAEEMANWCRRFILFHGAKHPQEMGQTEINAFLQHVAKTDKDPLRGIAQAHAAMEFSPAGVTSPLDVLGDLDERDLRDAVDASRRLA